MIKELNSDIPLLFLGDHHGDWNKLFYVIRTKQIENCTLISVGDLGIGFKYREEFEHKSAQMLSDSFKERNIHFYGIRGNHDNPKFFKESNRIQYDNFELLEDYSVASFKNKKIQFIGGAVSIDRTGRKPNVSYWEDEGVVFIKNQCQQVDVLVTHTAPSFCFPRTFNEIVYGWAREDAYLLEDLADERAVLDEIFKLCNPSFHVYGHFHSSWTEEIENCKHKLLNINELIEYV